MGKRRLLTGLGVAVAAALAAAAGAGGACVELDEIEPGCGNHVVEQGEDCDAEAELTSEDGATRCADPGQEHACHYVADAEHVCPSGFVSGDDGRCREPSGRLGAGSNQIEGLDGRAARAADLDGDGQPDLFATSPDQSASFAFYLQSVGTDSYGVEAELIPSAGTAIADLDGDGVDDVVAVVRDAGMVVFRGSSERDLQPVIDADAIYDARVRYGAIPAVLADFGASRSALEARFAVYPSPDPTCPSGYCYCLRDSQCPSGPFPAPGGSSWQDLVVANDGEIVVATAPEEATVWWGHIGPADALIFEALQLAQAPGDPPARVIGGPVFHDIDGDGEEDLIVVARVAAETAATFVLPGPWSSWTSASELTTTGAWGVPIAPEARVHVWFANDDLAPDYVVLDLEQSTLFVSREGAVPGSVDGVSHASLVTGDPWASVAGGDLNGDGRDDLAAAVQNGSAYDIVLGGELFPPSLSRWATVAPVSAITVGDVDGDGLGDVLSVQGGPVMGTQFSPCEKVDELHVAYGRSSAYPETSVRFGALPGVHQLLPVRDSDDLAADIALASSCQTLMDDRHETALVLGDAHRELYTPFIFQPNTGIFHEFAPTLLSVETVELEPGAAAQRVIVALGTEAAPGSIDSYPSGYVIPFGLDGDFLPADATHIPLEEPAAAFAADPRRPQAFTIGSYTEDESGLTQLSLSYFEVAAGEAELIWRASLGELSFATAQRWRIQPLPPVGDGGGTRFLVVVSDEASVGGPGELVTAESLLALVSSDGSADPTVVPIEPPAPHYVTDVALLAGTGPEEDILVSTGSAVFQLQSDGTLDEVAAGDELISGFRIVTMATADFSGDGLEDLLVIDRNGARVFPQLPR